MNPVSATVFAVSCSIMIEKLFWLSGALDFENCPSTSTLYYIIVMITNPYKDK